MAQKKNKKRLYKQSSKSGGFGSSADGRYDPASRLDPLTQELKSDPFAYGRKKSDLTYDQKKRLHQQMARNANKYGVGAVTGAGSVVGSQRKNEVFTVLNAVPKKSETAIKREQDLARPYVSAFSRVMRKSWRQVNKPS